MGRNRRKNVVEAGHLNQQRLCSDAGSSSDSGMPADGGDDDPELYTKPSSRNRGRRGSGKLQGGSQDGSISSGTTRESIKAPADGGHVPITLTKEGSDDQHSHKIEHRTDAEVFAEPPIETNRDKKSLPTSTLHAESGLPGVPRDETDMPTSMCTPTPADQDQVQQQTKQSDVQGAQSRNMGKYEKKEGDEEKETVLAMSPHQLAAEASAKNDRDGGFNNDSDSNSGLPATSTSRGVVVPALPFDSTPVNGDHGGEAGRVPTAVVVADDKPYSLAWAGGRKGRPLMKSVEIVLSEWLCAQEAKVSDAIHSADMYDTANFLGAGSLPLKIEESRLRGILWCVRLRLGHLRAMVICSHRVFRE